MPCSNLTLIPVMKAIFFSRLLNKLQIHSSCCNLCQGACLPARAENCSKNSINSFQMKIFNIKKFDFNFIHKFIFVVMHICNLYNVSNNCPIMSRSIMSSKYAGQGLPYIPIRKQSQSFCIIPMALLRSLHASKLNLLLKENSYESSKL